MARIILALAACAAFCGTTVSALCDNSTSTKIKACVFQSDLFMPNKMPTDNAMVTSYCGGNVTINCLATHSGECQTNARQTKLINQLLTTKAIAMGQASLCNLTAGVDRTSCYNKLKDPTTKTCFDDAVGAETNVGDELDLKISLDAMCTFFDAYVKCLGEECTNYASAMNGIRYHYCSLSSADKQAVVTEYETGSSASFLAISVMSIITAIFASFVL